MAAVKIYTRKGDDGTTGLYFGGRVSKASDRPSAYGAVDEAQSFIGLARAEAARGDELDEILVAIERDLWVLMAEMATDPDNFHKLTAGATLVTPEMVTALEVLIDEMKTRFSLGNEFVVPGQNRTSALLDVARTVVRRAERDALRIELPAGTHAIAYLNRLSDLLWALARWQDEGTTMAAKAD